MPEPGAPPLNAAVEEACFMGGPMADVTHILRKISLTGASFIIWGESGTGKNLFAYLAHRLSPRHDGPYAEISCSALPESLVETELFGYVRGAFTGAAADHAGRLIQADKGTLVLDELDHLSPAGQAKLLRVVETGRFSPIGSQTVIRLDTRFIGITQQNPEILVQKGLLRPDLYYRISLFSVGLPPLREATKSLAELTDFLANDEARRLQREAIQVTPSVLARLSRHDFPGNIRELRNLIRRWTLLKPGKPVTVDDLPGSGTSPAGPATWPTLQELEREHIRKTLALTGGRKTEAARLLGIHRKTLLEKRKLYDLD